MLISSYLELLFDMTLLPLSVCVYVYVYIYIYIYIEIKIKVCCVELYMLSRVNFLPLSMRYAFCAL